MSILGALVTAIAQPGADEQLAAQYFQQGEYERAILYYEKLYKKQPTPFYYEQLYKSYVELRDLSSAEKLVKDHMRRSSDDPRLLIDLGHLYKLGGEGDKAEKEYDKALKQMRADQSSVRSTANAFVQVNEIGRALEAYQRGGRMLPEGQSFNYEIAGLYGAQGDVTKMVSTYMDLLIVNEGYIQAVQNALSRSMDLSVADARSEILRTELLRRIQKDPQHRIFPELLIWMYIQQKDMNAAFVQSKAMDKRFDEGGVRLMDLASIALANKDHAIAFKCYEYVLSLGRNDANYVQARIGAVRTRYEQLTQQPEPAREDLVDLDQRAANTLTELGLSQSTTELLRDRAHLKAYYLNDTQGAIELLEQGIAKTSIDPKTTAQLKLDLGDIHPLSGDIWEASLLYSQVDLAFKYDMLGHEARLRNAKVSFYSGDFLWAQGQLEVLKASTSKLIANDAMELSLRITDNLGLDSNSVPLSYFARAELLRFQHRYNESLALLDSLQDAYPGHSLGDDILYERFRIAYARHRYAEAASQLEKLLEYFPTDILVDNALLDLGKLYEERLSDPVKAQSYYERLLFEQTGSIFVPEARDRFRRLRGDVLEAEPEPPPPTPHP
ncbi:MAG: tetratricopeptide repeat protein [Flavobacteriales bacterium]